MTRPSLGAAIRGWTWAILPDREEINHFFVLFSYLLYKLFNLTTINASTYVSKEKLTLNKASAKCGFSRIHTICLWQPNNWGRRKLSKCFFILIKYFMTTILLDPIFNLMLKSTEFWQDFTKTKNKLASQRWNYFSRTWHQQVHFGRWVAGRNLWYYRSPKQVEKWPKRA